MFTTLKLAVPLCICCATYAQALHASCSDLLKPDNYISLHQSHIAMAVLKQLKQENSTTYGRSISGTIPFSEFLAAGTYKENLHSVRRLSDLYSFDMTHDEASGILQTSLSKDVVDGFVKCKQTEALTIWLSDRSINAVVLHIYWRASGDASPSSNINIQIIGGSNVKGEDSATFTESVGFNTSRSIIIYRNVGSSLKVVANQGNASAAVSLPGKIRKLNLTDTKDLITDKYPVNASHGGSVRSGQSIKPRSGYIILTDSLMPHFECKEGDPKKSCSIESKAWIENLSPWGLTIMGLAYPTTGKGTYLNIWATGTQQKYDIVEENF